MKFCASTALLLWVGLCFAQSAAPQPSDYAERVAALERRHAADPNDPTVLDMLAGSYAMAGDYRRSIEAVRMLALLQPGEPSHRVRIAHLYAWSGDPESALRELRSLGDKLPADAREFECSLASWSGDSRGAARCYSALLMIAAPSEGRAALELNSARNLAWSGETEPAVRAYRSYLSKTPADSTAALELARVLCYNARFDEAAETLTQVLKRSPQDVPALALRSEVLHWMGRGHEALDLARQALRADPDSMDARVAEIYALRDVGDKSGAARALAGFRERVRTAGLDANQTYAADYTYLEGSEPALIGVGLKLPFSTYNDSDGIHQSVGGIEVNLPLGNHAFWLRGLRYEASAPDSSFFSFSGRQHALVVAAGGSIRLNRAAGFEYSFGGARTGAGKSEPVYSAGLRLTAGDRAVLRLGAARSLLAITPRSIGMGIASKRAQASFELALSRGASILVEGNRSLWNDGNHSYGGSVRLSQTFRPSPVLILRCGPSAAVQSFARDMRFNSGFFTPDLNDRYEGFATVGLNATRRLNWEVSSSAGVQRMSRSADFRGTWEVSSAVTVRLNRVLSISGNYERRNYSLLGGTGYYQGAYFQLNVQRD